MRGLALRDGERESGAMRYVSFRQSPWNWWRVSRWLVADCLVVPSQSGSLIRHSNKARPAAIA